MDWIKKHVDQFALAALALVLLALSAMIFLKTQSFAEGFADADKPAQKSKEIKPLDITAITAAQKALTVPGQWTPKPDGGSLFVSKRMMVDPQNPRKLDIVGTGMTHPPVPDAWLLKYDLDILSAGVLADDPDKDGFSNLDEYLGPDLSEANKEEDSTNPRDKESHPPYYTRLFLKQWIKIPFRLIFNAYDDDPKKVPVEKINFQINTLDLRQPSEFLKLGQMVPNTKFKLTKFEHKEVSDPNAGTKDVSELTLHNTVTNGTIVLVYQKEINSPDSYAHFLYLWPDPKKPQELKPKKLAPFGLPPNETELYKLVDIKEDGAVISLPGGDKTYNVPLLQIKAAPAAPAPPPAALGAPPAPAQPGAVPAAAAPVVPPPVAPPATPPQ